MYGAPIEDNAALARTLRLHGFRPVHQSTGTDGKARLWSKGPRHGRRYVAFLTSDATALFVARPKKDDFIELPADTDDLDQQIHQFVRK